MSSSHDVDSGEDRVKGSGRDPTIFADSEVIFAFIEAKPDVDFIDMLEGRVEETVTRMQEDELVRVESKIGGDESKGLTGPDTGVARDRDSGVGMGERTTMR